MQVCRRKSGHKISPRAVDLRLNDIRGLKPDPSRHSVRVERISCLDIARLDVLMGDIFVFFWLDNIDVFLILKI